jgi:hypothetical protein
MLSGRRKIVLADGYSDLCPVPNLVDKDVRYQLAGRALEFKTLHLEVVSPFPIV